MPDVISFCLFKDPESLKTPPSVPPALGRAPSQNSEELLLPPKPAHQRKLSTEGGGRMAILAPGASTGVVRCTTHINRVQTETQIETDRDTHIARGTMQGTTTTHKLRLRTCCAVPRFLWLVVSVSLVR